MVRKLTAGCIVILSLVILLIPQAVPANAQEPTQENDRNCVSCHEHQYYLYDSGKWFCLCDAPMHCVYCHDGRTDSLVKEVAHEGLVLYPTRHHAERCQTCHTGDYMARVVTFESIAGVSATPQPVITATPDEPIVVMIEEEPTPPLTRLSQLEPWRLIGLGATAIALVGIIIFGYRCWKTDCLAKSQPE